MINFGIIKNFILLSLANKEKNFFNLTIINRNSLLSKNRKKRKYYIGDNKQTY